MRKCYHEARFETEWNALLPNDYFRGDAICSGIEWALERDPEIGTLVADNVRVLPCLGGNGFPNVWIYYTFNETSIFLLSVVVAPIDPGK